MIAVFIISAIVSYLVGGVNGAIMLSNLVYHQDIRDHGSGNPGFTNFKRVYGNNLISWSVLLIDVLKTALPVLITALILHAISVNRGQPSLFQLGAAYSGLFCMIGHCFPVWYGFKGGKAFIAGFATTWFVDWRMALIAMGVFFIVLGICRFMSVASCSGALTCPIALAFLGPSMIWVEILVIVSALLIIVRHYPNFIKLKNGTESKFSLKNK